MSAGPAAGRVYLVGAGPGSLDLVTLRARHLIGVAHVLVYDYLCNPAMLSWARPEAEIIYAGKSASAHTLTQDEINSLLVDRAQQGKIVVRLKGGDPYVFGRGGEEALVLAQAEIPFEVVAGVTSAIAAPSYAGIPVTHRGVASTVTFITGHEDPTKTESSLDWSHLAQLRGTKVFLMGVERLREITQRLMDEGADAGTPVALVRWGTTGRQESLEGTLSTIAELVEKQGFAAPAITVVGDVVRLRKELNWFEALPLHGKRIVVTRTQKQAGQLTARLMHLGADVLEIPTIRIAPVTLNEAEREKLAAMSEHFDWIVFTSPNGVDEFFNWYERLHLDIRQLGPVRFAAVGPATAQHIERRHLRVVLQPAIYTTKELAEGFSRISLRDVRFCIAHGNKADPYLADYLRKNGASVEEWIVYETSPETEDRNGARSRFLREGAHFITFTSASTVENWHALKLQPGEGAPLPRVVSIGPVTTAELQGLNYQDVTEASAATMDSLVETICRLALE
jgi:uroporphyrinogen III methyltransferase/synthase